METPREKHGLISLSMVIGLDGVTEDNLDAVKAFIKEHVWLDWDDRKVPEGLYIDPIDKDLDQAIEALDDLIHGEGNDWMYETG